MGKLNNEGEKPTFSHFSHEHPLELTSLCQEGDEICSGCNINIVAGKDYYTCKTCTYSLHRTCYNLPRIFRHSADPGHDLNLLIVPSFQCKACGLQGSGFSYTCSVCLVHYHTLCSQIPPTKTHSSHLHTLKLEFSPPYDNPKAFRCDVCGHPGFDHWLYRCGVCEFDVHLTCVTAKPKAQSQPQNPTPEHNNNVSGSSTGAPPINPSTNYVYSNPVMQPAGFNQGTFPQVNQGIGYPNPPSLGSAQGGVVGAGMTGLIVTGLFTGIGEGVGQEIVQGAVGTFFNDGSGSSDQNFWN